MYFMHPIVNLLMRVLPNRAGIQQHHIRALFSRYKRIVRFGEDRLNQFSVVHIHLAAPRLEVNFFATFSILMPYNFWFKCIKLSKPMNVYDFNTKLCNDFQSSESKSSS